MTSHVFDPSLLGKPLFAIFDPAATWLPDLEPAFSGRFPCDPKPGGGTDLRTGEMLEPA